MQLARLCLCASSAVACAVFTNRMRTWNRKLMIHVNKPRLNRSTSCIHHRYGTSDFFFFDVRRPEISSQIFRNEKNISWCHQHICNQISNNFVSCNEKISHIIRRVFILQLIFMVIFLSYKIFALPKITCRSAGLP